MPISNHFFSPRPALLGIAAATLVSLAACGGGNGSSDPGDNPPPPVTTGKVAILFADAPTDAFCQVLATVERVDLFGGSSTAINVFTGPETVDVLALRNYSDVMTIAPAVPVGTYSKVRMTLSDLALVECDGAGNPEPESGWEHPKLPGNGKLDLNPRGSFQVVGGETLVIELDLDMEKSLHLHQTGNGRWQFRPVIFVTIRPDDTRLVRVYGEARDLDGTTFELCPVEPVSSMHRGPGTAGTECLDVFTDGSTGLFDETGSPVGLGAVANGDLLTAIGFLSLHDNDDSDSRMDDLRLDAVVAELGELGTFERLQGRVVSAPGNNDLFVFDPTPADDATNAIDVRLQSGTRIFSIGGDEELTSAALQPGTTGEVDGVFTDPATDGEPLKSSLIVLDQDTTPALALLDAEVKSKAVDRFTVDTPSLTGKCVKVDAETRYLLITETANTSETSEILFADLAVGNKVDVFGADDATETACVLADTVQKYVTAP